MQTYLEPTNQFLCSTPYEHSNYININNPDIIESYRTCRYLNNNLKLFLDSDNNDTVLFGFEVISATISNHILQVNIGEGKLIQDITLVSSPAFTLTRDISNWESNLSNYSAIIYTDFKFPEPITKPTVDPGAFAFTLGIIENSSSHVETVVWDTDKNKLVLYAASLDDVSDVADSVMVEGLVYNVYDVDDIDGGVI